MAAAAAFAGVLTLVCALLLHRLLLFVMASTGSLYKQPGRTSNASRSRKIKICMKRSSAMPSCRSACVKRYSGPISSFRMLPHSKCYMIKVFILSAFSNKCSNHCLHFLRESRCGLMPRSVSTKCEPVSTKALLPQPACTTNRTLHRSIFLFLSHGYTGTRFQSNWVDLCFKSSCVSCVILTV